MSNPTSQARSGYAQGNAVKKNVKSKFSQGKAVQSKAAKFNKAVLIHMLLFFGMGLLLGLSVLLPFFSIPDTSLLKATYAALCILSLLFGLWHLSRAKRKIDWFEDGSFSGKLLLSIGVSFFIFLGIFLLYLVLPAIFKGLSIDSDWSLSLLMASTAIAVTVPFFVAQGFRASLLIEPKRFEIWAYPKNYIEKQPTWNRERLIFANLNFRRKEGESAVTTIKAKLPKEAIFGELIYLFIREYNENRSPDQPITQLLESEGTSGWMFWVKNKGLKGMYKSMRLIETSKTVEENGIDEDDHVFFERILESEV